MSHRRALLLSTFVFAACSSSSTTSTPTPTPPAPADLAHAAPPPSGIDTAGMDKSVAPGDDFFAYANGTWLKTTEIPADRSSWGVGAELAELTTKRTADLITEQAKHQA